MTGCFNPLGLPDFFPSADGDCEAVLHDMNVVGGDLATAINPAISAILIQLNTDAFDNGQRGFWGDQFLDFPIGCGLWKLSGQQAVEGVTVRADQMIREAIEPLIDQGLVDDVKVRVIRTASGIDAEVDAFKSGKSIFGVVFNG